MSLKLIREAQLVATLSKAEIQALSIIKDAAGATSLVDVLKESFTPTPDDFDAWMRVVVGEAQDRGINLNKKTEFIQLVMDVLENDPANPPFDMQEAIASKLWQDYKGAKNEVRINKIAAAKEEEEKVDNARKQIAARYTQGQTSAQSQIYTANAGEEEERPMQPMGMSDELAARKIFQKIQGTPNLNFVNVERMVARYAPMVGKAPTDVKHIATQVYSMLQDVGMEEEETVDEFLARGKTIQQIAARKPRKEEKWQGSAHIGKGGDGRGAHKVTTGKAANTMGKPVIGLSKVNTEEEESGFAQVFKASAGIEDEEQTTDARRKGYDDYYKKGSNPYDPGTNEYTDWYIGRSEAEYERHGVPDEEEEEDGMSFLKDVLKNGPDRGAVGKGSFSSHLRGEDDIDDDAADADEEMMLTLDTDLDGDLSDDEVFTSNDDDCDCPCEDDEPEDEFDDELSDDDADVDDLEDDTPEEGDDMGDGEFDDNTMDDMDADAAPRKSYDEEEAVKSFFRQAATAPRNMMTAAIKDIEGEGKTAWTSSNVPKNPHPQKSAAYRAWQRGMLAAAKESLGIVDKPKDVKAKVKRKSKLN